MLAAGARANVAVIGREGIDRQNEVSSDFFHFYKIFLQSYRKTFVKCNNLQMLILEMKLMKRKVMFLI